MPAYRKEIQFVTVTKASSGGNTARAIALSLPIKNHMTMNQL